MRVKLISDFVDIYDHYFDVVDCDVVFSRKTTDGPNRIEMLHMLEAMGLDTPAHGLVSDIYNQSISAFQDDKEADEYTNNLTFVVYTDIDSHCGDNKLKLSLKEAFSKYPDCYATSFVKTSSDNSGSSLRMLSVGDKKLWMMYKSTSDWRSNCGDTSITEISVGDSPVLKNVRVPLYAIDFVQALDGRLFAVDFNVSPGVKDTPAATKFKPSQIAGLIIDKIRELNNEN